MTALKQQLYSQCLAYVQQRVSDYQEAILGAQNAANEETKSSAGDKYETGRAMAQLEIEKNTAQLAEAKKLMQTLERIATDQKTPTIQLGSVALTNHGNFYVAISAGSFTIQNKVYYAISPPSPIGQKLIGMEAEDSFDLNGKEFYIQQIG